MKKYIHISTMLTAIVVLFCAITLFIGAQVSEHAKIIFSSEIDGDLEIYVMDTDGKNIQCLTDSPAGTRNSGASWDPTGKRIAFHSNRESNRSEITDIYIMDTNGQNIRRLTHEPGGASFPIWSPDGGKIAFGTYRDGDYEIYIMDADGKNQRNLTNNPAADYTPTFSPDGSKIAFSSARDNQNGIYVMDINGKNVKLLTAMAMGSDGYSAWSPDGTKIAFVSDRNGSSNIYVMDANGDNQKQLTNNGGYYWPAWSPDCREIAFLLMGLGKKSDIFIMDGDGQNPVNLTNNNETEWITPQCWFDPAFQAIYPVGKQAIPWGWIKQ